MTRRMLLATMALLFALVAPAKKNVYGFAVTDADGNSVSMKQYKGKVLLIVNTATRCGFTPQYEELEALYEKYRAQGFEILDFPCNQFGEQAPGTIAEIHQFCTANFNIQFPQFDKVDVNGPDASPLFAFLRSQRGFAGFNLDHRLGRLLDDNFRKKDPAYDQNPDIKWNFTKFLVDRKGRVVQRFEPTATAADMEEAIRQLL
ncbi:MAG: glutathione peroxidase [Prevotella sp.]|nr:glutathione peroxidase [Prevotella sp.]